MRPSAIRALAAIVLVAGCLFPGRGDAAGAAAPADSAANALVEQVVSAYGGRAALDKIQAYRVEGRVVAAVQGREGPTVRLYARPNRLRVELNYPGAPELRILRGAQGWRGAKGDVQAATGPMLDAMTLQAARAGVPWVLMEHAAGVHAIAPMEINGRELPGLEIALAEGLILRVFLDPATHRVERSQGVLDHGPMRTMFETTYEDFRTVDGVLFPFHEENFASGQHTGTTFIERVEWNPKFHEVDFGPPGKGRT